MGRKAVGSCGAGVPVCPHLGRGWGQPPVERHHHLRETHTQQYCNGEENHPEKTFGSCGSAVYEGGLSVVECVAQLPRIGKGYA